MGASARMCACTPVPEKGVVGSGEGVDRHRHQRWQCSSPNCPTAPEAQRCPSMGNDGHLGHLDTRARHRPRASMRLRSGNGYLPLCVPQPRAALAVSPAHGRHSAPCPVWGLSDDQKGSSSAGGGCEDGPASAGGPSVSESLGGQSLGLLQPQARTPLIWRLTYTQPC